MNLTRYINLNYRTTIYPCEALKKRAQLCFKLTKKIKTYNNKKYIESQVLKGPAQAKIIKKSVILSRVLNMTI